jgi:hypothetical protein
MPSFADVYVELKRVLKSVDASYFFSRKSYLFTTPLDEAVSPFPQRDEKNKHDGFIIFHSKNLQK